MVCLEDPFGLNVKYTLRESYSLSGSLQNNNTNCNKNNKWVLSVSFFLQEKKGENSCDFPPSSRFFLCEKCSAL